MFLCECFLLCKLTISDFTEHYLNHVYNQFYADTNIALFSFIFAKKKLKTNRINKKNNKKMAKTH